jgi:hypothetical protein
MSLGFASFDGDLHAHWRVVVGQRSGREPEAEVLDDRRHRQVTPEATCEDDGDALNLGSGASHDKQRGPVGPSDPEVDHLPCNERLTTDA